ncbi:MAG: rRNA maturation RNase YbeY [Acidimicrobiia bacterium]|nr:rRNA maturation RNase YbeY [Acidimicrobiia bacterium]MXY73722.1 rRNA maturation RNase YbeY [Acidimicrobiia bacterium]MYB78861.1 rRNA maturation RNase YbeY [Acidimicrobiia bacterium]MYG92014.1 rRNA maturation RNase YbeY [Acidimicrobiia bacterium]
MTVQIIDEQGSPVDHGLLGRLAGGVLAGEGYGRNCLVDVTLVPEGQMAEMNFRHRGYRGPTDVLAFPLQVMEPGDGVAGGGESGPPLHLGDIVIAPDYVTRQAARVGTRLSEEMGLMVVHGVLHLLGYRHDSDSEAEVMEQRERRHLAREGLKRR